MEKNGPIFSICAAWKKTWIVFRVAFSIPFASSFVSLCSVSQSLPVLHSWWVRAVWLWRSSMRRDASSSILCCWLVHGFYCEGRTWDATRVRWFNSGLKAQAWDTSSPITTSCNHVSTMSPKFPILYFGLLVGSVILFTYIAYVVLLHLFPLLIWTCYVIDADWFEWFIGISHMLHNLNCVDTEIEVYIFCHRLNVFLIFLI